MYRTAKPILLALALAACSTDATGPIAGAPSLDRNEHGSSSGAVYTLTNAVAGNDVLVFRRGPNGSLTSAGAYATGGEGSGNGLGSQGAVSLSDDGDVLLAVNAGSNEISSFEVGRDGALALRTTVPSGGVRPISITRHGRLVYALNAGGSGNIAGFRIDEDGELTPIAGSARPLSSATSNPAQVQFDPSGNFLVVTEKGTDRINTYRVGRGGYASGPIVNVSAGQTPFGFEFGRDGALIVSEAFGGAPDASAVSSYRIGHDGRLTVLSASVPTTETAACWVAVNGRFAYATNTGSNSVSGYEVRRGHLRLIDGDGKTGITTNGPTDADFSGGGRFLYTLEPGGRRISIFATDRKTGALEAQGALSGLGAGMVGLAAR